MVSFYRAEFSHSLDPEQASARVGFSRTGPNSISAFAGRLKYVNGWATVGVKLFLEWGYVQTGGQFKQLGEEPRK